MQPSTYELMLMAVDDVLEPSNEEREAVIDRYDELREEEL